VLDTDAPTSVEEAVSVMVEETVAFAVGAIQETEGVLAAAAIT